MLAINEVKQAMGTEAVTASPAVMVKSLVLVALENLKAAGVIQAEIPDSSAD